MKKILFILIIAMLFLAACREQSPMSLEELDRIRDESSGTKNYLWFTSPNMGLSNFAVNYKDSKLIYSWKVHFNEKFYQKVMLKQSNFYYKIVFPTEVSNILKINETDYFMFHPFESNGKREYTSKIELELEGIISPIDVNFLRNNLKYELVIADSEFNNLSVWRLNADSKDMSHLYK